MLNAVDLSRTDLNLLTLFDAVLAEGHVGRAAERLHLTPSAVSHGLGRLRRLLNDPLFLRTPKGVRHQPAPKTTPSFRAQQRIPVRSTSNPARGASLAAAPRSGRCCVS